MTPPPDIRVTSIEQLFEAAAAYPDDWAVSQQAILDALPPEAQLCGHILRELGHVVLGEVQYTRDRVEVAAPDGRIVSAKIVGEDLHLDYRVVPLGDPDFDRAVRSVLSRPATREEEAVAFRRTNPRLRQMVQQYNLRHDKRGSGRE